MYMLLYLYIVFLLQFQCCEFNQTISNLKSFCYSDMDDTIVNFSKNYLNSMVAYNTDTFGVHGYFGGIKVYTDIK